MSRHGFSSAGTIRGLRPTDRPWLTSVVRTPMKGTSAVGYGGCCGEYVRSILSSDRRCAPATGTSSETTAAVIQRKTRNLIWAVGRKSPAYDDYLREVRVKNSCVLAWPGKQPKTYAEGCNEPARIGSRILSRSTFYHPQEGANPQSEYIATNLYRNNCLPTPSCKAPFPMFINPTSCANHPSSPQEAIKLGLLPDNWGNCTGTFPGSRFNSNPYLM